MAWLGGMMVYDFANGAFLVAAEQISEGLWLIIGTGLLFYLGTASEGLGGGVSGNWWIKS